MKKEKGKGKRSCLEFENTVKKSIKGERMGKMKSGVRRSL